MSISYKKNIDTLNSSCKSFVTSDQCK